MNNFLKVIMEKEILKLKGVKVHFPVKAGSVTLDKCSGWAEAPRRDTASGPLILEMPAMSPRPQPFSRQCCPVKVAIVTFRQPFGRNNANCGSASRGVFLTR